MPHPSKTQATCALCGTAEAQPGTFPFIIGLGRICMSCGMKSVKCELCGADVKLLTSSRLQGRTLCLADYMKEIEKFRKNITVTYDEGSEPVPAILSRAHAEVPEGYTLLAVRRARGSTHLWEAEYEKTEIFQSKCG